MCEKVKWARGAFCSQPHKKIQVGSAKYVGCLFAIYDTYFRRRSVGDRRRHVEGSGNGSGNKGSRRIVASDLRRTVRCIMEGKDDRGEYRIQISSSHNEFWYLAGPFNNIDTNVNVNS